MVLMLGLAASVGSGCSDATDPTTLPAAATPAQMVLTGGRIHTVDADRSSAEAVAITDGRFVFVGSDAEAEAYIGAETERYDLDGRLVLPGIIDAHTHPGLISILGDGALGTEAPGEEPPDDGTAPFPRTSVEDIQDWLRDYVAENDDAIIFAGSWPNELFGPEGPRKEWLDEVAPDRLITLFDESGHSQWMNSLTLQALGVDENTPDPVPGLSEFVRDPNNEPTGWVKEFAAVLAGRDFLVPDLPQLRANLREVVDWLAARGITALMDAGNLDFNDEIYGILAGFEAAGELPLRYEGSFHIYLPELADVAVSETNRLRREYGGERLTFDTIKIHFDGVHEIRTASVLEPYSDDPDNYGQTIFPGERMTELLLEMQGEGMNLHVHANGAGAVRIALDAVEAAQKEVGGELDSRVTLSHIEIIGDSDVRRFVELGVIANYTPSWHGEGPDPAYTRGPLGPERNGLKNRAKLVQNTGAVVTYSSDEIDSVTNASPFYGIQVGHTRQYEEGDPVTPPVDQRLTLDQLLDGYTINAAYQQRWEDRLGSIEVGKLADLVVLDRDIFNIRPYDIAETMPVAVLLDGKVTQGRLPE